VIYNVLRIFIINTRLITPHNAGQIIPISVMEGYLLVVVIVTPIFGHKIEVAVIVVT
jgi:hypothetical protein